MSLRLEENPDRHLPGPVPIVASPAEQGRGGSLPRPARKLRNWDLAAAEAAHYCPAGRSDTPPERSAGSPKLERARTVHRRLSKAPTAPAKLRSRWIGPQRINRSRGRLTEVSSSLGTPLAPILRRRMPAFLALDRGSLAQQTRLARLSRPCSREAFSPPARGRELVA